MNHTLWTTPNLHDIEFLKGQYTGVAYTSHFHEEYVISVVERGVHAFRYRGDKHIVHSGSVVTCQPDEVRSGCKRFQAHCHYRSIFLRPALVQQIAAETGHKSSTPPVLSQTEITDRRVVEAVRTLHHSAEARQPTIQQEVLLYEMLTMLLERFSEIPISSVGIEEERLPISRAKDYINDHYGDEIQLEELAALTQFSKNHFIRVFRHYEGITPYAYLVQVRLNRAKALLREGHPAAEVAQRTGFHDQSHLIRYFKHFLSLTPGQYQKAIG